MVVSKGGGWGFGGGTENLEADLERMTLSSTSCSVVKIRIKDPRR